MPKQTFSESDLLVVNESVAMAEEIVSNYYKMSASEWLRPKFDVKTGVDLATEELVEGPFAQVILYEGRIADAPLGSSTYDFYKICLQDHEILAAIADNAYLQLMPFVLYIVTHELIHIVRFSKFLQRFNAQPEERVIEESRVHELTHAMLRPIRIDGLSEVLEFYMRWRQPIDDLQAP